MRIALIHATPAAMAPVTEAFARHWPEAEPMHVLDDTLSRDRAAADALTNAMATRIRALADYARTANADAILYTCSAFGPAIRAVAADTGMPVLTPNGAMFAEAHAMGGQAGLLASFPPSIASMVGEYAALQPQLPVKAACAPEALEALTAGDAAAHDRLLAEAAVKTLSGCDVIMLAQFSTARARATVAEATGRPVLTSPDSAVCALRDRMNTPIVRVTGHTINRT